MIGYVPAGQLPKPVRTALPPPSTAIGHVPESPVKTTVPVPPETWAVQEVVDPKLIGFGAHETVSDVEAWTIFSVVLEIDPL